jgi:hypothetical protein
MSRDPQGYYPIPQIGPDVKYPSVTHIQGILDKPWLSPWRIDMDVDYLFDNSIGPFIAGDMGLEQFREIDFPKLVADSKVYHADVSGEAKDFGSRLHAALDAWHKDSIRPIEPDLIEPFAKVIEWEESVYLKTIESEGMVFSESFRYAGSADHYADIRLDEKPIRGILDYKCRNGKNGKRIPVYQTDRQQIGAYVFAREEMSGLRLDYGGVIIFNRDANRVEPHVFQRAQLEQPIMEFLELSRYYQLTKRRVK